MCLSLSNDDAEENVLTTREEFLKLTRMKTISKELGGISKKMLLPQKGKQVSTFLCSAVLYKGKL
jgi:hypothetical protein